NGTRLLMTEIYVFDTIQLTWSLKTAKSPDSVNIDPRVGHSAVLAPDNHTIVIFGGTQDGFAQITAYPVFTDFPLKCGNITNDFGPSNNTSAYVYLMDLSNYTWVTQFAPTDFGKSPSTELVIIICSIFGLLIIGAI
ncbi:6492_t:CDS:2, partial [Gigaspora rosea]